MLEIVQEILEAEQKAEAILAEARERAGKLRADAESNAQEQLSTARARAAELVQTRLGQTRADLDRKYQAVVEQAAATTAAFPDANAEGVDALISNIVQFICEPEYRRI